MRIDQYAFVPARGGVFTVDGALPFVEDDWQLPTLQALLPPTRYLRLAAHVEIAPDHFLRLRTFEPADEPGAMPNVVPEALRPAFDQAVAELLHGVSPPPRRPAWSQPGWHEQAEAWAGMPLEQVRSWPISCVMRGDGVFFKAVAPFFAHEPAITHALGEPRVLQIDHARGWMLLEEVHGECDHHEAMRSLARVHREWTTRIDEAIALGARDRRAASALPHTLVHGDFHPGNVLGSTIIDWSDAAIANPLVDVNHYLLNVPEELRSELSATYAAAWPEYDDVPAAIDACEAETYEYIAGSYLGITDALADDDRFWFESDEARWLQRASEVRAGKRPSRGT